MRGQDFWLGGDPNLKSHAMTSSEIFEKDTFSGPRYHKMEDQKPWPGFSRNQDFAERRGLTPKAKMSELGDTLNKLMLLKRTTAAGRFFVIKKKKLSYFNAIKSHFGRF